MRKALKNQREVAHVWAQQSQQEGYAAHMFFEGKSIFSYGHHFEIARFVNPSVVLFNEKRYSSSTGKHQSYTHSAVSHKTTFTVPSFTDHKENMTYFLTNIEEDLIKAMRGRAENVEWRMGYIKEQIIKAMDYVETFARKSFSKEQLKALQGLYARRDSLLSDEEKTKLKEKIKAQTIETKKRNAAREAERLQQIEEARKQEAESLAKWIAGEDVNGYFPNSVVHLRIKDETIQTTKGAEVPLIEARKLWHMLQDRKDVSGMRVGHYTVTKCDMINLTVGCHIIPLKEVLRMGLQLGWKNEVLA